MWVAAARAIAASSPVVPHTPQLEPAEKRRAVAWSASATEDRSRTFTTLGRRVLDSIAGDGFALNDEGRLTGAPRGYRRDHPEIELLRQTSLGVGRHEEAGPWLYGPECVARVEAAWRVVGRWNAWLLGHVGAPEG